MRANTIRNMPPPTKRPYKLFPDQQIIIKTIPNMHELRTPLNNLLKKNVKWNLSYNCQNALNNIKRILILDLSLAHFDPAAKIVVASNTSEYSIGTVMKHKYKDSNMDAVVHVSHSLIVAEENYNQIEKEALAIIFDLNKFHRFLTNRRFWL